MVLETNNYSNEIEKISDNKKVIKNNSPFTHTLVYIDNNNVVGFLIYDVLYEKVEIIYIFVSEECRNKGIAKTLLNHLINTCSDKENITLEVKADNVKAINLYKKFDFKSVAIRKKYYDGIDGILMEKKINY